MIHYEYQLGQGTSRGSIVPSTEDVRTNTRTVRTDVRGVPTRTRSNRFDPRTEGTSAYEQSRHASGRAGVAGRLVRPGVTRESNPEWNYPEREEP